MDFRLTEDQDMLVASLREFLAGTHGPDVLRSLDGGDGSPAIWRGLVEMGLTGLLVPEADGGLGLGLVEAAAIAVELGRRAVAEPLVDTAFVAVPWLIRHGQTGPLAAIAAGEITVALAHPLNPLVADLDRAQLMIAGGAVIPPPVGQSVRADSVDPLRRLFAAAAVGADNALLDLAALMTAAQLVGLADGMLALAVEYAHTRQQFGQPIGAFQAVKHHLASAAVRIEFARVVVLRAAAALDTRGAYAAVHVSHAKVAATDAAIATAETAIQVHGAMGYTYEVDLHFWMKRSWALAGAWGDRAFHIARVSAAALDGAMPIGPAATFV